MINQIALINRSKRVDARSVVLMAAACSTQIQFHAAPLWGRAPFFVSPHADVSDPAVFPIYLFDSPDVADALGYHDETPQGTPYGRVFVDPILKDKGTLLTGTNSVSVVCSHECCELFGDPFCNFWADSGKACYAIELCLTGGTKIPLLNGTERSIESLESEEEFWVYGCTAEGRVVPARGHSARRTRVQAEVVEVLLDNGESVKCTPDHLFMLRDGTYAEAQALQSGTSLMPCYRRLARMRGSKLDYEQIAHPVHGEWEFTHRVVAPECPSGFVRHHRDFNRFNNDPENIQVMRANEHIELHGRNIQALLDSGRHGRLNPSPEKRARDAERLTAYNRSDAHREVARRSGRANMAALWERSEFREKHAVRGRALGYAYQNSQERIQGHTTFLADPERRAAWEANLAQNNRKPERRESSRRNGREVQASRSPEEKARLGRFAMHMRWHANRGTVQDTCDFCQGSPPNNHKVVSIRSAGHADVWDITVEGTHNFALSAGVFVHNCDPCQNDSYVIPIKGTNVSVSNFVLPAWFDPKSPKSAQFDYLKKLKAPFTMTPGGYVITMKNGKVDQQFGKKCKSNPTKRRPGGRTYKRTQAK